MEFKKLLNKVHDKVSNTDPWSSPRLQRTKDKKTNSTPISKWRCKWGDVSRSHFFSNKRNNSYSNHPLPQLPREPTITITRVTPRLRPQSTIDVQSSISTLNQRPVSFTPTHSNHLKQERHRPKRLSVPFVVDHLRSPHDSSYSSLDRSDEYDDAGSFYDIPVCSHPPKRRVTWYIPQRRHSEDNEPLDDDTTYSSLEQDSLDSPATSVSSLAKEDSSFGRQEPDDQPTFTTNDQENSTHYQLVILNVSNTMMAMREHQLELQTVQANLENQTLRQHVDNMINGPSTKQLLEENDRLEKQIQQLVEQQRIIRSDLTSESCWRDEQEALRHTRAQLGLVEYLEGEPDVMAALNRFKKLLTSSC